MRVMVIVKASKESEAGKMPSQELLTAMGNFNEQLVKAGVMLAGEGLHPSSKGKRVRFSGTKRTVVDGPFAETKELIAGFWLWQVKSMEEALEWVRRCPNPMESDSDIEIRPVFEMEDFGAELTPELRAQEERQRAEAEALARCDALSTQARSHVRDSAKETVMQVQPYLFFNGRCEEALEFYRRVLGAEVQMLMRYREAPEPPPPGMLPPGSENKVMHAAVRIGESTVMASDGHCDPEREVRRLLALAHRARCNDGRARVRCARRRRGGAHAARQDLLLALLRHAGGSLRRRLDGHRAGVATGRGRRGGMRKSALRNRATEDAVPYMLLIMEPAGQRQARSEEEGRRLYQRMLDWSAELKARGVLQASQSLRSDTRGRARQGARRQADARRRSVRGSQGDGRRLLPARLCEQGRGRRHCGRVSRRAMGHGRGARVRAVLHLT